MLMSCFVKMRAWTDPATSPKIAQSSPTNERRAAGGRLALLASLAPRRIDEVEALTLRSTVDDGGTPTPHRDGVGDAKNNTGPARDTVNTAPLKRGATPGATSR